MAPKIYLHNLPRNSKAYGCSRKGCRLQTLMLKRCFLSAPQGVKTELTSPAIEGESLFIVPEGILFWVFSFAVLLLIISIYVSSHFLVPPVDSVDSTPMWFTVSAPPSSRSVFLSILLPVSSEPPLFNSPWVLSS